MAIGAAARHEAAHHDLHDGRRHKLLVVELREEPHSPELAHAQRAPRALVHLAARQQLRALRLHRLELVLARVEQLTFKGDGLAGVGAKGGAAVELAREDGAELGVERAERGLRHGLLEDEGDAHTQHGR